MHEGKNRHQSGTENAKNRYRIDTENLLVRKFDTATRYHLLIPDHGYCTNNDAWCQPIPDRYCYRKYRLRYWYTKIKTNSEPVPETPKVGTELVLKIFRFGKFGTGTQYHLLISDRGFHTNNIVTIQLFLLILFRLSFSVFFYIFFLFL
ncbi:hypothetical protein Hanom_Chr01g00025451 [Helianthus anomalus]